MVLYAQPYSQELTPDESSVVIAKYSNAKINAKPNFGVISSENKEYIGVVWEIPGRKTISDSYGYVILDDNLNILNEGAYNIPLNGNLTSINEHHISNTGDYFLSLTEHKRPNDKIFSKDYDNFKALHVYKIKENDLTEFSLKIEDKRIDDVKMSSNDVYIYIVWYMVAQKSNNIAENTWLKGYLLYVLTQIWTQWFLKALFLLEKNSSA